jgi:hypothetical protein
MSLGAHPKRWPSLLVTSRSNQQIEDDLLLSPKTLVRQIGPIVARTCAAKRARATASNEDDGLV